MAINADVVKLGRGDIANQLLPRSRRRRLELLDFQAAESPGRRGEDQDHQCSGRLDFLGYRIAQEKMPSTGRHVGVLFIPKGRSQYLRDKIKANVREAATGRTLANLIDDLNRSSSAGAVGIVAFLVLGQFTPGISERRPYLFVAAGVVWGGAYWLIAGRHSGGRSGRG